MANALELGKSRVKYFKKKGHKVIPPAAIKVVKAELKEEPKKEEETA